MGALVMWVSVWDGRGGGEWGVGEATTHSGSERQQRSEEERKGLRQWWRVSRRLWEVAKVSPAHV